MEATAVVLGGQELLLLPERAVWWPGASCLVVADPHLGKEGSLRAAGLAVPDGPSAETLGRLAALCARQGAAALVVLGDLLHAKTSRGRAFEAEMARALSALPGERILVRGNHDLRAGDPPAGWGFRCVEPGAALHGLTLRHEPPRRASRPTLCGHLHPMVRLRARGRTSLRVPAFVLRGALLVLPAFGSFTGGVEMQREPGVLFVPCPPARAS